MSQTWRQNSLDGELVGSMFYTTYTTVRTAILTPVLVVFIFVTLRLASSRTLTQATLFNKIISVAVGSLVGSSALRPNSPLTAVVVATFIIVGFALLIDNLYAWGWLPGNLLHTRPVLLVAHGKVLPDALGQCLLRPEKLRSELRSHGHTSLSNIFAVVLEPTGTFAVITNDAARNSDLELLVDAVGFDKYLRPKHGHDQENGHYAAAPGTPINVRV